MTALINITEDEFDATYSLLPNHFNSNASWGFSDGPGCLFDIQGEELDFVRRQDPRTVWTFLDGDDGNQLLVSGYHFVNRIGYLISTQPILEDQTIEVNIPSFSPGE